MSLSPAYLITRLDMWLRERGYRLETIEWSSELECAAILLEGIGRNVEPDADLARGWSFADLLIDALVRERLITTAQVSEVSEKGDVP